MNSVDWLNDWLTVRSSLIRLWDRTATDLGGRTELGEVELLRFDAREVVGDGHVTSKMVLALRAQPVDHLHGASQQHAQCATVEQSKDQQRSTQCPPAILLHAVYYRYYHYYYVLLCITTVYFTTPEGCHIKMQDHVKSIGTANCCMRSYTLHTLHAFNSTQTRAVCACWNSSAVSLAECR